jgi:hypothetical protein
MAEIIKLTEEEITTLEAIKRNNKLIIEEFGKIEIVQLDLDTRRERAETFLANLRQSEVEISKTLEEKYGKGTVNLDTGEFNSLKK